MGAARLVEQFLDVEGKTFFQEFRVVKSFSSEEEAREYAKENGIKDVRL
jgi:hypothetical protein